jgi:SAM-dependent methyltransferase
MQDNNTFWQEQAKKFKDDIKSVNFDHIQEQMEMETIAPLLSHSKMICDLGCGIGQTIFSLIEKGVDAQFHGLDFTKEMIDVAKERKAQLQLDNVSFYHQSATDTGIVDLFDFKFDTLISKRLLINLKGDLKLQAIQNIHDLLAPDGLYIMVENFIEPLDKTNQAREILGLDPIQVHHFNEYLKNDFLDQISDLFELECQIDPLSSYYFISRVLNAYDSKMKNESPHYDAAINLASLSLFSHHINPISGYAPERFILLRKKGL